MVLENFSDLTYQKHRLSGVYVYIYMYVCVCVWAG